MRHSTFIIIVLFCIHSIHMCAAVADSLAVSLLTCSSGDIAYTMYGHTAIRVNNITTGQDWVFNYGMFDFDEDNFVYKFVKGETDYILGAEPAGFFIGRYKEKGMGIHEQVLNLSQEECHRVSSLLLENIQPQNRTYRYSWLYDNCTTRARDLIEKAVNGHINYKYKPDSQKQDTPQKTAREMLHPFASYRNRWVEFGQNLLLGYEIDRSLTPRESMFLPTYFMSYAGLSNVERKDITNNGDTLVYVLPLVKSESEILQPSNYHGVVFFDPPLLCFIALFVCVMLISIYEIRRGKTLKWIDVAFSVLTGIAGIVVSFLFFFSEHPGVDTNVLVILFNPLPFCFVPFILHRKVHILSYVILADFVILCVAIIASGQHIDCAMWPLVSSLLLRVIVNIWLCNKKTLTLQSLTWQQIKTDMKSS